MSSLGAFSVPLIGLGYFLADVGQKTLVILEQLVPKGNKTNSGIISLKATITEERTTRSEGKKMLGTIWFMLYLGGFKTTKDNQIGVKGCQDTRLTTEKISSR